MKWSIISTAYLYLWLFLYFITFLFKCGSPNHFMTSAEIRFFWLPLSTMDCNEETFIHICEWKRHSPSSRSSDSFFWILVVVTLSLGSVSIIYFPLSFPFSGSDSELEDVSNLKAFSSATSDCLAWHSLVLWVELSWNSHNFPVSFFVLIVLFFICNFGGLSWVTSPWLCPFLCALGGPFPCLTLEDPKSRFFYLNFCSILTMYQYVLQSEEMFINSISSWMYLCR